MDASDSTTDLRIAAQPVLNQSSSPPSAASQAFYKQFPPKSITRSMIICAAGSAVGMVMFGIIQGTVLNFFLEDLNLKERIPWFTGLLWLSGIGSLLGSWIQERWGHRRMLMIWCCGSARLVWLFMGLLPFIWPEKIANGGFFYWISACTIFFYFVHSIGANAWLAWMSDLVPPQHQSRFWSFRQVGTYTFNSMSRLGCGYYLEQHRNMTGYAMIFGLATLTGIFDVLTYFWVDHREPKKVIVRQSVLRESLKRLKGSAFQKLCGIYLFWLASNCLMAPTVYYFLRDHVKMGPYSISQCMTISILIGFALLSPLWGYFANNEGHRRAVLACLVIQNSCTFFYWFCAPDTLWLATTASTLEQIGTGGITLFMFPMMIYYTQGKGSGRAVGMASFTALLSFVGFGASVVADRHIYNWVATFLNAFQSRTDITAQSVPVYLGVMVIAFVLRGAALVLAWLLPPCERQLAAGPGTLILRRISEGPMRTAQNMLAYAAKRFRDEGDVENAIDEDEPNHSNRK